MGAEQFGDGSARNAGKKLVDRTQTQFSVNDAKSHEGARKHCLKTGGGVVAHVHRADTPFAAIVGRYFTLFIAFWRDI